MPSQEQQHSTRFADILRDVDLGPHTAQVVAAMDAKDRNLEATYLNPASVCVTRTSDLTVAALTTVAITFGSKRWDTSDGKMWLATYPTRLYAPQKGIYLISGTVRIAVTTAAQGGPYIRLNGTTKIAAQYGPLDTGSVTADITISRQWLMDTSDYVELTFLASAEETIKYDANLGPDFTLTKIRDA